MSRTAFKVSFVLLASFGTFAAFGVVWGWCVAVVLTIPLVARQDSAAFAATLSVAVLSGMLGSLAGERRHFSVPRIMDTRMLELLESSVAGWPEVIASGDRRAMLSVERPSAHQIYVAGYYEDLGKNPFFDRRVDFLRRGVRSLPSWRSDGDMTAIRAKCDYINCLLMQAMSFEDEARALLAGDEAMADAVASAQSQIEDEVAAARSDYLRTKAHLPKQLPVQTKFAVLGF